MPFTIVAVKNGGSIAAMRTTAREAVDVLIDYRARGYQQIEIKDG